jgi:hypothetical protein
MMSYKNEQIFATNKNRNFTEVKKMMWLLLAELEKELKDVNGNEICANRTAWDSLCGIQDSMGQLVWNTGQHWTACVEYMHHVR